MDESSAMEMETSVEQREIGNSIEIPCEIKNDLIYCQKSLSNHVLIHQKLAMDSSKLRISEAHAKKSMEELEKEIISIDSEQKVILNRLRLFIDYYLLRNQVNRKKLTDHVSKMIAAYAETFSNEMTPFTVQPRRSMDELYQTFISNEIVKVIEIDDDDDEDDAEIKSEQKHTIVGQNGSGDGDDEEIMEVMVSPDDISIEPIVNGKHDQKRPVQQESLLKPKEQRISLPKEEQIILEKADVPSKAQESISLSRLKLKEALCKAKVKMPTSKAKAKSKSASPVSLDDQEKPIVVSSSQSSTNSSSSEDIFETIDWSKEEEKSSEIGKEAFMRIFGLYTLAHSQHMKKRRTERRRRNCTSTERGDFHYGKFDLFERQYAKRPKRQFLYSPPATRARKQRRAASDAEVNGVSAAFLHGSVRIGNEKVCVTCFKKNNLTECRICQGKFHVSCHKTVHDVKEKICPLCCQPGKKRPRVYHKYLVK